MLSTTSHQFFIAQIGKTHGLWGDLKIHFHTDFPEQFQIGKSFESDRGKLQVARIDLDKGLIGFVGYGDIDTAKRLTNTKIYTSLEETQKSCDLQEGQYFWFDIIGLLLYDHEELLGKVSDIQRILNIDYLQIDTDTTLIEAGFAKSFLVPYIPRYILSVDKDAKKIVTQDTKDILEAS
ncbi:MAG: ribosome maturation factor RimM [Sulfurovum sp. PC08-66]|jgi:16S rRNA processing protein RimM|nr:MAG: ribosome maturation factor RimM [Sulfurovum sp. PC08-66]